MIEEFEDVELPPDNPDEWKECHNCTILKEENTRLRTQEAAAMLTAEFYDGDNKRLVEENKELTILATAGDQYGIEMLKLEEKNKLLRLALDKIKHKTTVYQSAGHVCDAKVDNDAIHQIAKAALGEK